MNWIDWFQNVTECRLSRPNHKQHYDNGRGHCYFKFDIIYGLNFTVNSIDYILKPVDEQRLSDAIANYEGMHQRGMLVDENYLNNLLDTLMSKGKKYRNRFMISDGTRFWSLQVEDIAYFYSEDKITYAATADWQRSACGLTIKTESACCSFHRSTPCCP